LVKRRKKATKKVEEVVTTEVVETVEPTEEVVKTEPKKPVETSWKIRAK
jgi:hypothetical protein